MSKKTVEVAEFTFKAVVVGLGLGVVFGAANAYLGLRVGMATAGAFTGIMTGGCHDYGSPEEHESCADAAQMTLGTMVLGSLVDVFALSWDRKPARAAATRPRPTPTPTPIVAAGPGGFTIGVGASF